MEFSSAKRDRLKGSMQGVFENEEMLFEGIEKKRFLRVERACLKGSVQRVFESRERLFEMISAWSF